MIELQDLLRKEIDKEPTQREWLMTTCSQYILFYSKCTPTLTTSFKQLLSKYNSDTILSFITSNAAPISCVHVALVHSLGGKELFPCMDNNGSIYPADEEIGAMTATPDIIISEDNEIQSVLRYKYHSIIFMFWLANTWMEVEGYKYNVVVKTLENNSADAFYFNDFQFNAKSSFHSDTDCREMVSNFTVKEIEPEELFERMMERYRKE